MTTREPRTSGSLHLPADLGVGATAAKAIEDKWNTIEAVDERLKAQGIHAIVEPNIECPEVTTEALTTTDVTLYTTMFSAQLRWYNYVVRIHAEVRAVLLQVTNEMTDIESTKRTAWRREQEGQKKSERMSKDEMEDLINQDPRYRELRLQKQQLDQQRIKLDAWSESLDRNLKTVSRQIELRRGESAGGTRENNMAGHAGGRWERDHARPVNRGGQ